uniref:Uncharacterized protein n=1 Tax=Panagrolaimus sp. PS1159 TaxID=55785 RepID=A0AC35FTJ3_9BILA
MNSKFLVVLCLIGFVALISATDGKKPEIQHDEKEMVMPEVEADSDSPHDRVRRQWGYGGYGGYGMGMYRPYGMMGMYRPYGMMGMYRPYGMMGMFG